MEGGQELLSKMTYTAAVIKETLRLWPPAGTARMTRPGAGIRVQTSIGDYSLEGVSVYNCAILIQRDPEVYGDTANDFLPERWLDNSANQIPASAWRAFERGPRNCIGQELVAIEARVIIALVARRFDFIKVSRISAPSIQALSYAYHLFRLEQGSSRSITLVSQCWIQKDTTKSSLRCIQ